MLFHIDCSIESVCFLKLYMHLICRFYLTGQFLREEFCKILEINLKFCCYAYWNLHISDTPKKCFVQTYENFYLIIKDFRLI